MKKKSLKSEIKLLFSFTCVPINEATHFEDMEGIITTGNKVFSPLNY